MIGELHQYKALIYKENFTLEKNNIILHLKLFLYMTFQRIIPTKK